MRAKGSTPAPPVRDRPWENRLRRLVASSPPDVPLPTTRSLGEQFGVANTTVFRALQKLIADGELWQHPNGRFYPAAAQALLERPKPVACLTRRLELCSELYRELLEGVSAGCGANHRTMLIWHDELLLNHHDAAEPPVFANARQQNAILKEFLLRHAEITDGVILDHIWSDSVLENHADQLRPGVVLFRRCEIQQFHNVQADFDAGALQALSHLLGRGFDAIVPVEPFQGDPAVTQFLDALETSAAKLGCKTRLAPRASAATPRDRGNLIARTNSLKGRHAFLCPEDNVAVLLLNAGRAAGTKFPDKLGLLSVMGTDFATRERISCLRYDFRALGRLAVESLTSAQRFHRIIPPSFVPGDTT
ncbi:MAG TPA: substrate-binding domain-containing protein [Opitutaceae bacterium]|nr:substrate-binding domain-containing protein [Opitutaceae bacterium]